MAWKLYWKALEGHDMRRVKAVLLVVGIVVIAVSVYRIGPGPILAALARLAWWQLIVICLPYAAIMAVDTLGWRFAFLRDPAPFHRLYGARLAGEALNLVTALGSVGGEAVKAWLIRRDVTYEESVPSVVIAKTTSTIAQALFLLIGVTVAWTMLATDSRVITAMLWLLVVEVAAVAGFVGVQVMGIVGRAGRLLEWFGVVKRGDYAERLDVALRDYYRRDWRRLSLSTGFHLAGWLLGAVEAFVILFFLGIPATLVSATVIEALGAGVRFATFLVPASLGAFESANAAAFEAMGLGAGAGLAFSFVRRARQLVWIGLGLLVLAVMGWRARRAGHQASVSTGPSSSIST
ncbi:MAG: lysylphosphatidylglycerol synthase transmembrane domain-containing protein [Candidatus Rokuibacteriota bacterium]